MRDSGYLTRIEMTQGSSAPDNVLEGSDLHSSLLQNTEFYLKDHEST